VRPESYHVKNGTASAKPKKAMAS